MNYSVVEAKNDLSKLIARAEAGEEVKITRRGVVVAVISRAPQAEFGQPFDVEWFRKHRITPAAGPGDIVKDLEQMGREYDEKFL